MGGGREQPFAGLRNPTTTAAELFRSYDNPVSTPTTLSPVGLPKQPFHQRLCSDRYGSECSFSA